MASNDEKLATLQAIFPSWHKEDLSFTLQDAKGNVEEAAVLISEGRASQFTQASRKKPAKATKETQTQQKTHTNRNADSGGWEVAADGFSGGRGGRVGRGGRGGRGGEPFRGGRGGRGGFRGGLGGFANTNGHAKPGPSDLTTTATTTEGWANQVEQATTETGPADDGGWGESAAEETANAKVADTSKGDDFSGSGGWGDAPAPKELEKAVKAGGKGWQKEIDRPVQVAPSTVPAAKPKLTWAQIAKPAEKPKPVPLPAPVVPEPESEPEAEPEITSDEPVAQEEAEVAPEAFEDTPAEPVEAWGDAPAPAEVEAEAAPIEATPVEEPFTSTQAEDLLPEEVPVPQQHVEADSWESDPAIAGSGAQPEWAQEQSPPAPAPAQSAAPEPVTTYQGPPGFNSVVSKAAPGVQAQQPRSSSRAAQRFKDAEGQGVVLPPTVAGGLSSMEMQFGSLSFGGLNGDGVDTPVPEAKADSPVQSTSVPAPAPAPAAVAASPVRSTQPPAPAQPSQPQQAAATTPAPAAAPAPSAPFYSQPITQQSQAPAQAPQAAQPQQGYTAPHQTLQQQMQAYQYLQQHQQAPAQTQTQEHALHQPQQNQYYRQQHDFYNPLGSQPQQTEAQSQQHQPTSQPQAASSPYDPPFGGFGQHSHLFGQPAQQNQHSQSADPYGAAQRSYDSYAASGYPRPPVEESKAAAPAPSHTPTAPAQPPHQQGGYYSQVGNVGHYYQQGPYNPYYQYGQGPQGGFQQYYPLAQRNLYGQPAPQAPPAQIPQATKPNAPASQSPYGVPPSYSTPGATYDDQSFGGLGRYGDSKAQQGQQGQQGQQQTHTSALPQSYGSQGTGGLHNFFGNTPSATTQSRPQAATPEDGFKSASVGAGQGTAAGSRPQQNAQQTQGQAQGQAQAQGGATGAQQGFGSYPYGGGAGGYGGQDWGQYGGGGHYGQSRNGYSHWTQ